MNKTILSDKDLSTLKKMHSEIQFLTNFSNKNSEFVDIFNYGLKVFKEKNKENVQGYKIWVQFIQKLYFKEQQLLKIVDPDKYEELWGEFDRENEATR